MLGFSQNRKLNIICLSILILLVVAYSSVYLFTRFYLKSTNLRELIINQAEQRLSRKVNMDDDLSFSIDWNMSPTVIVHHLTVANSDWSKHSEMLTVDTLSINFSLMKLLFKEFNVISLDFVNPIVYLEKNGTQSNWDFINSAPDPNRTIKVTIHDVTIKGGKIVYQKDDNPADTLEIDKLGIHGNSDELNFTVNFSGEFNNLPIQTMLTSDIGDTSSKFTINKFTSNSSDLNGTVNIQHKPMVIKGKLESNTLDLSSFFHSVNQDANPSGEYSLPNTPLPIADLKGGDVEFQIKVQKLIFNKFILTDFHLIVSDQDDVISIKFDPPAELANGTVDLNVTYDLKPTSPVLNFNLKTNNLKIEDVLAASGNRSPLSGSDFSLNIYLQSNGDNLNTLVGNANGQILAQLGPGQFLNTTGFSNPFSNVLSSVITFNKQQSTTAFTCGVLNLRVNNGVGSGNNNVGVEAASVQVLGNGMVDLRNGRIKFTITPTNVLNNFDITQFNMAQLIQISGTISNPQITFNPINVGVMGASVAKIASLATGLPGIAVIAGSELTGATKTDGTISPCKTALAN